MRRDMVSVMDSAASYEVCFDNPFKVATVGGNATVFSSGFQMLGANGENDNRTYYFEDDAVGNLRLFYFNDDNVKIVTNTRFRTVDYEKGEVQIGYVTPVTIVNTSVGTDVVEIRAFPGTQDVLSKRSVSINFDVSKCDIVSVIDTNVSAS